jgi:hypothetical protein
MFRVFWLLFAGLMLCALPNPELEPTIDGRRYAELLGVSYGALLQNRDNLPVRAIAVGRKLRFPTRPVLISLGLESPGGES